LENNIEKKLFPNSNKLIKKDDAYYYQIIDAELDPLNCRFTNDDTVEIDVSKYNHIILSYDNLEKLLLLIEETEELLEDEDL